MRHPRIIPILLAACLLLGSPAYAQTPPPQTPPSTPTAPSQVRYLKLTIKQLKVWPVKPTGKCWDPCLGKRYKLPARGNKDYNSYFKNKNFRTACSGTKAPDPLVEIQIGRYEKFTTDKQNNQCKPNFGISHTYRVTPKDSFVVSVYDNDGAAGIQFKRDLIGRWTSAVVPGQLLNGQTLTLRGFGQVVELQISAQVIQRTISPGCEGVYKVRIAEVEVNAKKENGKTWDRGFGGFKKPDVVVSLKIGPHSLQTPKQQDSLKATFYNIHKTLPIKQRQSVILAVFDKDPFGRKETIGQTAVTDICSLINASGSYTFAPFGQVKKVVLLFEKQK